MTQRTADEARLRRAGRPPERGKSTLLNRLVGQKLAIVSDKPQTTRNRIVGVTASYPGKAQIVFLDTPGVHKPLHRLNVRMVDAALDTLRRGGPRGRGRRLRASPRGGGDRFLMDIVKHVQGAAHPGAEQGGRVREAGAAAAAGRVSERKGFADIVPVSALTGENVDRLEQVLLSHLPEGEPIYPDDYLTDQPERFFVAELVREQVLQQTRDELPFSTAVVVDKFEEPDAKGLMRLYCTILVERETQKPILVGRAGARIKAIGTAARKELERSSTRRCSSIFTSRCARGGARTSARSTHLGVASATEKAALVIVISPLLQLHGSPWLRSAELTSSSTRSSGLLRIGATANLLNLLQKQHPADLAQIFGALLDTERQAVFSLLVERNGRLAMETVSEMGPEAGAKLLTGRSAEEIAQAAAGNSRQTMRRR